MTDEKYTFVQDVREKKDIAKSSRNRRAHAGKGGGRPFSARQHDQKGEKKYERRGKDL